VGGRNQKGRMGISGAALALVPEATYKRALVFDVSAGSETLTLQAESQEQLAEFSAALEHASSTAPPMRGELSFPQAATLTRTRRWTPRFATLSGGILAWHDSEAAADSGKKPVGSLRLARGGKGAMVLTGAAAVALASGGSGGGAGGAPPVEDAIAPQALVVLLGRVASGGGAGGATGAGGGGGSSSSAAAGLLTLASFRETLFVLAPSAALAQSWEQALQLALRAESGPSGGAGAARRSSSTDNANSLDVPGVVRGPSGSPSFSAPPLPPLPPSALAKSPESILLVQPDSFSEASGSSLEAPLQQAAAPPNSSTALQPSLPASELQTRLKELQRLQLQEDAMLQAFTQPQPTTGGDPSPAFKSSPSPAALPPLPPPASAFKGAAVRPPPASLITPPPANLSPAQVALRE